MIPAKLALYDCYVCSVPTDPPNKWPEYPGEAHEHSTGNRTDKTLHYADLLVGRDGPLKCAYTGCQVVMSAWEKFKAGEGVPAGV